MRYFTFLDVRFRRILYESKGDTIVSLMYSAAEGDIGNLKRYKNGLFL